MALDPKEMKSVLAAWGRQQEALFGETSRIFIDLDLTMGQFRALVAVRRAGRLSGRELAAKLRVNPATVIPLIDRLEDLGYLKRVPGLEDRRLTWLELTPTGEQLFHKLWAGGISRIAKAVAHLTRPDRDAFKRLLDKIADHLEAQSANADASDPFAASPDRAPRGRPVNSRVRRGARSTHVPGPAR
jgi:DNA-binding MarR family transcriptional regulator